MTRLSAPTDAPAPDPLLARATAVILNPAARSTRAARRIEAIRALVGEATIFETRAAGDARSLAATLARDGWATVVAAGGDGTVNEVVAGLLESGAPVLPALGLLPMGTMNVFALELGLPVFDLDACWRRLATGRSRAVDAWQAGPHVFVQMAGVGVDATVIRQTSWEAKKSWGPLSYLNSLARVLDQPPAELRLQIDDGPWLDGTSVLLGNGRFYGGPLPVFPQAANDDGLIDVALIHGHGPATFSNLLADVLLNSPDEDQGRVTRRRGQKLIIESASPVPYEVDGELAGETPLHITRHPSALHVLA